MLIFFHFSVLWRIKSLLYLRFVIRCDAKKRNFIYYLPCKLFCYIVEPVDEIQWIYVYAPTATRAFFCFFFSSSSAPISLAFSLMRSRDAEMSTRISVKLKNLYWRNRVHGQRRIDEIAWPICRPYTPFTYNSFFFLHLSTWQVYDRKFCCIYCNSINLSMYTNMDIYVRTLHNYRRIFFALTFKNRAIWNENTNRILREHTLNNSFEINGIFLCKTRNNK